MSNKICASVVSFWHYSKLGFKTTEATGRIEETEGNETISDNNVQN